MTYDRRPLAALCLGWFMVVVDTMIVNVALPALGRDLDASVAGLHLVELAETEVCCGFGGTFCVKYPEISDKMVTDKAGAIAATGADAVLAGDLGCLLNIAGRLARLGIPVEARHIAEVLAGMADDIPAIGAPAVSS